MADRILHVLFLCTGNSARSVLAEAILNHLGGGRFKAHSAGSFPKGQVHPLTIETLKKHKFETDGFRSKSWDEFAKPGSPPMDFVFTVCDNAAGEVCPIWPGHPITAHWGFPDPAAIEGADEVKQAAFDRTFREISQRLRIFLALPFAKLDRMSLQNQIKEMGRAQ